ncbi:MAG: DUF4114 domain-containing protein [Synechococcales bacterium]|nr:DUF4114 domain-containing protein [Synechococcales bacterium]
MKLTTTFVWGMAAAIATVAAVSSGSSAQAFTLPSSEQYYERLDGRFGLEYDTWVKFNGFVNKEQKYLTSEELTPLNIEDLTWEAGVNDVEVFFINEGAGYHNKFFFSTDNGETLTTIFENASSPHSILANGGPLALGEGRNLGSFSGNTVLSFLLKNPNNNIYGADPTKNQDGLQHVTAFKADGFMILGFEDLDGGGDRDYNDVVVAIRGLVDTQEEPAASVPEPTSILAFLGMGLLGMVARRR